MARELVKWEPFREVSRLRRDMDRLWDDFFGPSRALRPWTEEWVPAVDVAETAAKVTVKAEVPGLDPKEIDISLVGDLLTIKGEKKSEREEKKENYHLVERSYGSFSRSIRLPAAVNADKIEARYEKGDELLVCGKIKELRPRLMLTHGGLRVDAALRVLGADGAPLAGLYAAGNASAAIVSACGHGYGIGWAIISGRRAGQSAARAAIGAA